jgi:hypothetical protein
MRSISCVVFFDLLGEPEAEEKICRKHWASWQREYPVTARNVRWTFTDDPRRLIELIPGADFVFFDYGGLSGAGHQSLGVSFARELEKHIVECPSVEFILLCTMGKHWYEDDYTEEHPNLHFEDVNRHKIFSTYIGETKCLE